jgi:hypothetical protein
VTDWHFPSTRALGTLGNAMVAQPRAAVYPAMVLVLPAFGAFIDVSVLPGSNGGMLQIDHSCAAEGSGRVVCQEGIDDLARQAAGLESVPELAQDVGVARATGNLEVGHQADVVR